MLTRSVYAHAHAHTHTSAQLRPHVLHIAFLRRLHGARHVRHWGALARLVARVKDDVAAHERAPELPGVLLIVCDPLGEIVFCNPASRELLNWGDDIFGMNLDNLMHRKSLVAQLFLLGF